ncbi:4a-hydroxytetrahydrobiopterin dehydratase [Inhella inkyongensis]|uniref:Putative pterin-4-alpha-carbinolamine dehydratase n=1 Tax=Inhella inkyongensis TaxID=392593 RepID=A0A840S392_9BURK|nr:4a-hydroxytetrahydrobiopterin dehydratase [Inhella inkyongensis]MBB5203898.1 4a-hydroxytetrahydrobiopterin dehydratase [Inhella inkyongensis]
MNLLTAQCQAGAPALDDAGLALWLPQLPGWEHADGGLRARFEFDNFYQVMAFANAVADLAHAQDHHPDLALSYSMATVRFSTHSAGGKVSMNDVVCAAQVNLLPEARP